jgi:hypothetical protein
MNITFSLFMLLLPAWIRGRASSVVMLMVWLGASIGGIGWGAAANAIGIGEALLAAAAAHLLIAGAITRWMPLAPEHPPA